jgi:hypothetical protein
MHSVTAMPCNHAEASPACRAQSMMFAFGQTIGLQIPHEYRAKKWRAGFNPRAIVQTFPNADYLTDASLLSKAF